MPTNSTCVIGPHALLSWAMRVLGEGLASWGNGQEAWAPETHRLAENPSQLTRALGS